MVTVRKMDEDKEIHLVKEEEHKEKHIVSSASIIIKDILAADIKRCKENIFDSRKRIEQIRNLLKINRFDIIKNFFENRKTILDTAGDESLQSTSSKPHPAVLAAYEQLFQLKSRPKRQAAKKAIINTQNKKSKQNQKLTNKTLNKDVPVLDNSEIQSNNICASIPEDSISAEKKTLPILNANRTSRFYTHYTLLIGNTSQFVGDDNADNCTHRWCVYVRRPEDQPKASEIIRKVRFHLDASYKPNDVIEVIAEPFSLCKRGWGEFPVKIEMFFNSKDKSVSYIHNLKLDKLKSGRYCLDSETAVEVALDINPNDGKNDKSSTKQSTGVRKISPEAESDLALTNLKNIMNNSKMNMNENLEPRESNASPSKSGHSQSRCISKSVVKKRVYTNQCSMIHCVENCNRNEYLVRVNHPPDSKDLKYAKTQEKLNYFNQSPNDLMVKVEADANTTLSTYVNKSFESTTNRKRKISEPPEEAANKIKVIDSLQSPIIKYSGATTQNTTKSLEFLNKRPNKKADQNNQTNLVQGSSFKQNIKVLYPPKTKQSLLKMTLNRSSLLKCNNLNKSIMIKQGQQSKSNNATISLLSNSSLSNNNRNRILYKCDDKVPNITIMRKGNSVLTTQNSFTSRSGRIQLSPERRLLGPNRNEKRKFILPSFDSRLNNGVLSTLDKDIHYIKSMTDELSTEQIVEHALRRIPLYVKPESLRHVYFDVPTQQEFTNYSLVKQIRLEIKRSKCISNFLKNIYSELPENWDFVNIFKFSRARGFLPKEHKLWSKMVKHVDNNNQKTKTSKCTKNIKKLCISYSHAKSLFSYFDDFLSSAPKDIEDITKDIDVISVLEQTPEDVNVVSNNAILPVLFGEKGIYPHIINSAKTAGATFQPELLVPGVDHPSVLEILGSVLRSFLSELIRKSFAISRAEGADGIDPQHIFSAILSRPEFDVLTNEKLDSKQ